MTRVDWTKEEDLILQEAIKEWGHSWKKISMLFPTKTEDACRNRWIRIQKAEERRKREIDEELLRQHFPEFDYENNYRNTERDLIPGDVNWNDLF